MSHTKPIHENYSIRGYFQRYGQIGTHLLSENIRNDFLLTDKENESFELPVDYEPVPIELSYFDLYQKVRKQEEFSLLYGALSYLSVTFG